MRYADTLLSDGEVVVLRRRQHWLALIVEGRLALALWLVAIVLIVAAWYFNLTGDAANVAGIAALVCLGLGLVIFAIRYWQWWAQDYVVTNRRLMKVTGVLNKDSSSNSLEKINDAILHQSLVGRILNYGDVDILTASGELARDYFQMIHGAKDFKRVLTNQKHALELEYRFDRTPSPPFRASPVDMNGELVASSAPQPIARDEPQPDADEPEPAADEPRRAPVEPPAPAHAEPLPPPAPAPAATADRSLDITQTLARLADLRDRGAISDDEYEAKKDELLGRL